MGKFFRGNSPLRDLGSPVEKSIAAQPALIYKSAVFEAKELDARKGTVLARVNSLGVEDLQHDVMEPGCWTDCINSMHHGQKSWPTILWNHNWEQPVGKVAVAFETEDSLMIRGKFNLDTERGRSAFSDVSKGLVSQWSVGFMPAEDGHSYDRNGVHHVSRVGEWAEVSCVLLGASPHTATLETKNAPDLQLAWRLGPTFLRMVRRALQAEQEPAAEQPLRPTWDQPTPRELDDPVLREQWRLTENGYVRREPDTDYRQYTPAPKAPGEAETLEEILRRWAGR
jgi:HK97 family phage prohead protease